MIGFLRLFGRVSYSLDSQIRLAVVKGCLGDEVFEDFAGRHERETDKIGGQKGSNAYFYNDVLTVFSVPNCVDYEKHIDQGSVQGGLRSWISRVSGERRIRKLIFRASITVHSASERLVIAKLLCQ